MIDVIIGTIRTYVRTLTKIYAFSYVNYVLCMYIRMHNACYLYIYI